MSTVQPAVAISETQPLLGGPNGPSYDADVSVESPPLSEPVKPIEKRPLWKLLLYIASALVAVGLVALFIKGFIDADDVEVRYTTVHYQLVD